MGLLPYFLKMIELSPPRHGAAAMEQGEPGRVIEQMLTSTGLTPRETGTVTVWNEWPDVDLAVRALAAAGPSVLAIRAVGPERFSAAMRDVIEPLYQPEVGVRISSEFGWITAATA